MNVRQRPPSPIRPALAAASCEGTRPIVRKRPPWGSARSCANGHRRLPRPRRARTATVWRRPSVRGRPPPRLHDDRALTATLSPKPASLASESTVAWVRRSAACATGHPHRRREPPRPTPVATLFASNGDGLAVACGRNSAVDRTDHVPRGGLGGLPGRRTPRRSGRRPRPPPAAAARAVPGGRADRHAERSHGH